MRKILIAVVLALLVSLTASAQNAEKTRKLEPLLKRFFEHPEPARIVPGA
jgi:hypothetical protein